MASLPLSCCASSLVLGKRWSKKEVAQQKTLSAALHSTDRSPWEHPTLLPWKAPGAPWLGVPSGRKASCHLAKCGGCLGSSCEAGGRAGSSRLPSCLAAAQLARPGCPDGPSEDNSMQGEDSAALTGTAGMCTGTSWSSTPTGRGGGRGEGPGSSPAHPAQRGAGGREEGQRLHTLKNTVGWGILWGCPSPGAVAELAHFHMLLLTLFLSPNLF